MASNAQIKGITIKIEGDTSPLAKDLTSVNKEISQTSKALKDVQRALELDPGNVELLEQQQILLNRQIEETRQKLELEKQAAEDAKQALEIGSISQEEYATLTAEVARTESALNQLESSAEGSADGLEEAGTAAEDAGDSAKDSAKSFEEWGAVVKAAAEVAAAAIGAVTAAVGAAAGALVDSTLETADLADELLTLSTITGVSTDSLQAMNYASELLDVSTQTITGSMTKLLKSMSSASDAEAAWLQSEQELSSALSAGEITIEEYNDAMDALGASGTAFDDLGISVLDAQGNLRDSEEVFWEVIDALGEIDNESERDAAAMAILGRSARELNPLIEAGSDRFNELAEEAENVGYIMDGDTLNAFHNLDDNMERLSNGATAARNAIGSVLLPVLTELSGEGVSLLNEFTNAILDTNGDVEQMGAVIDEMVPQVLSLIEDYIPTLIDLGGTIIESLASALLDNLDLILSAAISLVGVIAQGILDNLNSLAPVIADLVVNLANFIVNNLPMIIDAALEIVLAVVNGISSNLDTLIPAAVSAVLKIAEGLIDNTDEIILASYQLLLGVASGIVMSIPDIVAEIPGLIAAILGALGEFSEELPNLAREWGSDFISTFKDAIVNAIPNLVSGVEQVASTISDYLHFSVPEKGPLADFDESGGDMIDLFIKGMKTDDLKLQRALESTANIIYGGMNPSVDYSGALGGISSQLASMGGSSAPQVINVYIGSQKFATAVVNAQTSENSRAGGI